MKTESHGDVGSIRRLSCEEIMEETKNEHFVYQRKSSERTNSRQNLSMRLTMPSRTDE